MSMLLHTLVGLTLLAGQAKGTQSLGDEGVDPRNMACLRYILEEYLDEWVPGTIYLGWNKNGEFADFTREQITAVAEDFHASPLQAFRLAPRSIAISGKNGAEALHDAVAGAEHADVAWIGPRAAQDIVDRRYRGPDRSERAQEQGLIVELGHHSAWESRKRGESFVIPVKVSSGPRAQERTFLVSKDGETGPWYVSGNPSTAARIGTWANLVMSLVIALVTLFLAVRGEAAMRRVKFRATKPRRKGRRKKAKARAPESKPILGVRFRRAALGLWSLAWMTLVAAWILIVQQLGTFELSAGYRAAISTLENLNSAALILGYMAVTRGLDLLTVKEEKSVNGRAVVKEKESLQPLIQAGLALIGTFAALSGFLYLLCYLYFGQVDLALQIHQAWSLCLSSISCVVIGWAFIIRFDSTILIAVGLVYAVMQPLVYATEVTASPGDPMFGAILELRPVISMSLAFMKMLWSAAFITLICSMDTVTEKNLINRFTDVPPRRGKKEVKQDWKTVEKIRGELHSSGALGQFLMPFKLAQRSTPDVVVVLLVLFATFAILAVVFLIEYGRYLPQLATAVGLLLAVVTSLELTWRWIKSTRLVQSQDRVDGTPASR